MYRVRYKQVLLRNYINGRSRTAQSVQRLGDCGMDDQGSILSRVGYFSSPQRTDRRWGPPSLLSSGYQSSFLWSKVVGA
jgi:hypothetical protein